MRISDWSSDVCSSDLQISDIALGDADVVFAPNMAARLPSGLEAHECASAAGPRMCRSGHRHYVSRVSPLRGYNGLHGGAFMLMQPGLRPQIGIASCSVRECQNG